MSSFVRPDTTGTLPYRDVSPKIHRSRRRWLLGRPLATADAEPEAIGKAVGLAVFASDALCSTVYATQEILVILAFAGTAAFAYAFPIAVAIVVPPLAPRRRWHEVLHAQTAVLLRLALLFRPGIVITNVPYRVGLEGEVQ